jgi:hypothetical protein
MMCSETARHRARLLVTFGALAIGVLVSACADKGLVRPKSAFNPKMTLQLVTTGSQTLGFGPKWLLVVAASATPKDTALIAYKYFAYAGGSQQLTLPVDISSCIAANASVGKDGCTMLVAAALTLDTTVFGDTTDNDLFSRSFDFAIAGPFEVGPGRTPTIPPIDLSASRFGVVYVERDNVFQLGGSAAPTFTNGGPAGLPLPITGVANGAGAPTLFALTDSEPNPGPNTFSGFYPQLAIFENGVWRRVTATTAPTIGPNSSGFRDLTALLTNEVYMAASSGLYKYDGASIARVTAVTDSLTAVASVISSAGKLVIAGSVNGTVWIGNTTTWQRYTLPANPRVDGVCITGPNEAFAASSNSGGLFRFDGTAWTSVPSTFSNSKIDLQCPAPGQVFVTSFQQAMLKWNGSGWTPLTTSGIGPTRLLRFGAVSANEVYAYGDSGNTDRAFYRYDGTAWRELARSRFTQQGSRPWAVPTGGSAYVLSGLGRLERITGTGVSVLSYQPSLRDVAVNSATSAFAVGWNLFLARWDGSRWNIDTPPAGTPSVRMLQSVWSDSPSNAWTVGNASTILRWNGTSWNVVSDVNKPVATADSYNGVWGAGTDVWAVGEGTILHCRSSACSNESSSGTGGLLGVWGSSATNVFAVGDGGRIIRYNGTSWSSMQSSTTRTLARVSGSGPNDVWALGDSTLLHFDGTSWSNASLSGDFQNFRSFVPNAQQRVQSSQTQSTNIPFGAFSLGLWVRGPKEVYIGSQFGGVGRYDGRQFSVLTNSSTRLRRRLLSISGAPGGCALAVSESQTEAQSPTTLRGVGPTGCFSTPMSGPTIWP